MYPRGGNMDTIKAYDKLFADRLASLRTEKGVSAREMSIDLGQNESYINRIENGKAFPSMNMFFYICYYLNITPAEFFEVDTNNLLTLKELQSETASLTEDQLKLLTMLAKEMNK